MQGLGSHNIYSSSTQDCANRFAAAREMYGFPFFQPFVDLDHVECMLIVGTNPVVSKWTFLQVAHPVKPASVYAMALVPGSPAPGE